MIRSAPPSVKSAHSYSNKPRWGRRLVTLPLVTVASIVVVGLSPLLVAAAAVADLLTDWRRRRRVRIAAMGTTVAAYELAAVGAALGLWVASGFGIAIGSDRWMYRHHRVQVWWANGLLNGARRWLGLRIDIDGSEHLRPGPVIVIARHTSFFDALLPVLVLGLEDMQMRYVLKRELAVLASFDLFGHRLPNYFVDREPTERDTDDVRAIQALAAGLGSGDAGVIFPEGTFYTPARQQRAIARVAERDAAHAHRAAALRYLLPPRPGGTIAMLEGAPEADVVVIAHRGFEVFDSFRTIVGNVPIVEPVQVEMWRVERREIPDGEAARVDWLYDQWERVDRWIDERSAT